MAHVLKRPIARGAVRAARAYSSSASPTTSPFAPRHLLSIADLSSQELSTLVQNAAKLKQTIKSGKAAPAIQQALTGKVVAVMFSKRSTRTRVSSEGAITALGGHPMFLGRDDIQLGVNETLYDTSVVISSMVSSIIARVHAHSDVADLAKHSSVPVINALSDKFHPMQTLADYLTVYESFFTPGSPLNLQGLKIAWVGDANNVLYDMAIGATKLGVELSVATPKGYEIPSEMKQIIAHPNLQETNVPEEAIKDADIIVTDTWISMGQEDEKEKKLKAFEGFQVTNELIKRGGAKEGWRFMHCLPRHPEEVDDAVFYSPRSLVFPEAENRLWSAIAALEAFAVSKGQVRPL